MSVRSLSRVAGVLALSVFIGLLGCSSTPEDAEGAGGGTGSEFRDMPADDSGMQSRLLDLQTIYFDFDSSDIRSDARPVLAANADAINKKTTGVVTIEGHCDERGSTEYNLALGERRANAVRNYLVDLGVPSSRLRTVSFGEDRAAVQGHDESAWRYNRRADFVQ